jgi:hypothetical protein
LTCSPSIKAIYALPPAASRIHSSPLNFFHSIDRPICPVKFRRFSVRAFIDTLPPIAGFG